MASRECPGCDKSIPSNVTSCPFCGRPLIDTTRWWPYFWLVVFLVAMAVGALWASTMPPTPVFNEEKKSKILLP